MWVSTHVLAGLAIAAALGGPWWLVLIVVILAHVVMDLIPHWDYTISRHPAIYGWCDFSVSLAAWLLAWFALGMPFWMAFMGAGQRRARLGRADRHAARRARAQVVPQPLGQLSARQVRTRLGHRRPGGDHGGERRRGARRAALLRPASRPV